MNPPPAPIAGDVDLDSLADWVCRHRSDWDPSELERAIAGARANHRSEAWIARAVFAACMDGEAVREFMLAATEAWKAEPEPVDPERVRAAADDAWAALGGRPATAEGSDPR